MTTEPKNVTDPNIPVISVGGRMWPIPLLAPRQNRIVVPIMMSLGTNIMAGNLTQQGFDGVLEIIYQGLTRAHPELTKDEFMDMEMTLEEQMNAYGVIALQTGMMKKADREQQLKEIAEGKKSIAVTETEEAPQTGTQS